MADDKGGYEELIREIRALREELKTSYGELKTSYGELNHKMDTQYRELKRDYRTLSARMVNLVKAIDENDYFGLRGIKVSVRQPYRTHNSITDPAYEKDYDFGPRPVYKKN